MWVREELKNIKLSLQPAIVRLQMYHLTVAELQIFLGIATQMEQYFRSLVANIATGGVFTPPNSSANHFVT